MWEELEIKHQKFLVPMWEHQGCQWIINIPSCNGKLQHKLHSVNILGDGIMGVC